MTPTTTARVLAVVAAKLNVHYITTAKTHEIRALVKETAAYIEDGGYRDLVDVDYRDVLSRVVRLTGGVDPRCGTYREQTVAVVADVIRHLCLCVRKGH